MSRKNLTSQEIVTFAEGAERVSIAARALQDAVASFIPQKADFDERTATMTPVAFLSLVMTALGDRAELVVRAAGFDTKALKAADAAAGLLVLARGAAPAGVPQPLRSTGTVQVASSGANEGDATRTGRAPKTAPDRMKNYRHGFQSGFEAAKAGTGDPAEGDKKGWTSRGYKAGAGYFAVHGNVEAEEQAILKALLNDLVAFGDHDDAEKVRAMMAATGSSPEPRPSDAGGANSVTPSSQSGDDEHVAGGIRNVESPPVAGDEGSGAAFEGEEDADRTFGGSSSDYGDDGLPGDDELSGAKGDEGSGEIPEFLRR